MGLAELGNGINTSDKQKRRAPADAAGFTMIELMIAMAVLGIGMAALAGLFVVAASSNGKNSHATSATMMAQFVMDAITSQPANASVPTPVVVTDCAGNTWQISTTNGAAPSGAGATLVNSSTNIYYGGIDPTQSYASIPPASAGAAGYAMQYATCNASGQTVAIYDVRWNIMTIDTNTRLVTVSARQLSDATRLGGMLYAPPVTLRSIGGS